MDELATTLQSLNLGQKPVYLLKTKSTPTDAYETHLSTIQDGHFKPLFVPVLEHMFRDDALRNLRRGAERFAFAGGSPEVPEKLRKATNNPAKKYGGVIFTSQRAVDAFRQVVARLEPAKLDQYFDHQMPMYVVGPATANGVRDLGLPCPVVGEESGNGDALARFILEHRKALSREVTHLEGRTLPLLFLVGEQRRDIIPKTLQSDDLPAEERTPVVELVVYETGEMATFEEDFTTLLAKASEAKVAEQWVVVFSPQGCEAMLMALGWLDEKTGKYSSARRELMADMKKTKTYVATIGPTTRDHLVEEFGFEPDVCAARPSPEGVAEGILGFEGK
jgi:uroporphyrinogen-III synthase